MKKINHFSCVCNVRILRDDSGAVAMTYVVFAVLLVAAVVAGVIVFSGVLSGGTETAGLAAGGQLGAAEKSVEATHENYEAASARALASMVAIQGGEMALSSTGGGGGGKRVGDVVTTAGNWGKKNENTTKDIANLVVNAIGDLFSNKKEESFALKTEYAYLAYAKPVQEKDKDLFDGSHGGNADDTETDMQGKANSGGDPFQETTDGDGENEATDLEALRDAMVQTLEAFPELAGSVDEWFQAYKDGMLERLGNEKQDELTNMIDAHEFSIDQSADLLKQAVGTLADVFRDAIKLGCETQVSATEKLLDVFVDNGFISEEAKKAFLKSASIEWALKNGALDAVIDIVEGTIDVAIDIAALQQKTNLEFLKDVVLIVNNKDDPEAMRNKLLEREMQRLDDFSNGAKQIWDGAVHMLADAWEWTKSAAKGEKSEEEIGYVLGHATVDIGTVVIPWAKGSVAAKIGPLAKASQTAGKAASNLSKEQVAKQISAIEKTSKTASDAGKVVTTTTVDYRNLKFLDLTKKEPKLKPNPKSNQVPKTNQEPIQNPKTNQDPKTGPTEDPPADLNKQNNAKPQDQPNTDQEIKKIEEEINKTNTELNNPDDHNKTGDNLNFEA